MITIGITGGIGSGKSGVSRILLTLGIPVYDSDSRAKWLNDHSPVVRQALTGLIGSDLYENGILGETGWLRLSSPPAISSNR